MADETQVATVEETHTLVVSEVETSVAVVEDEAERVTVEAITVELVSEQEETHVATVERDTVVVSAGFQGPPGAGGATIDDTQASPSTVYSSAYIQELLNPWSLSGLGISPSTGVFGQAIATVNLSWTTNYTPDSLSLNQGIGSIPASSVNYAHTGQAISTPVTYTLTAVRNGITKTASASISFLNRVYYGVNPTQTTDNATILGMTGVTSGTRARSMNFNCTGGRFFHYAYPSRLGDANFTINNLTYTDVTKTVIPFTNEYGYTENYNVYYCNVIQNGASITLVAT